MSNDTQPIERTDPTTPMWFDRPTDPTAPATAPSGASSLPPAAPTGTTRSPSRPRRWAELLTVAGLTAALASGGTYAAVRAADDGSTSSTTTSSSSLGRGTVSAPVVQADAAGTNWTATATAVAPSVVAIAVRGQSGSGEGSGVIIDKAGHILTNNHVVEGGQQFQVTLNDGRTYAATVAGTDPTTDLAVLTVKDAPSDWAPIALGDSETLKVGDPVMAVGNPLGLAGTVTTGIVSALNRPVSTSQSEQQQDPFGQSGQSQGEAVVTNAIQTSAAINPGNSGGALVNAGGQLVGINSSIASLGSSSSGSGNIGIGFAIPVNEAKSIATQLIETGSAKHAYLGVSLKDGSASDGSATRTGAEITQVASGTPGADAGLQGGDVVVGVGEESVGSADSLVAYIRERTVGDKVTLKVIRDGKAITLDATLAARPATNQ
ncbi:MAG: trypsin-like peptidase domain-containing protein [Micrococcales bacterium]|nr:trypsin-like peptidase domain-containing protein [Micrococcales bacterium]